MLELDDTYKASREEVEVEANSVEFDETVEAEVVEQDVVDE